MLDFKLLNSQASLNGELIFRAFLSVHFRFLNHDYTEEDELAGTIIYESVPMKLY